MAATINPDPIYNDRWLAFEAEGEAPRLGAQFIVDPLAELTIYWVGSNVAPLHVFNAFDQGADILKAYANDRRTDPFAGKIILFGKNMREEIPYRPFADMPVAADKHHFFKEGFDACRAELTGDFGRYVVWANLTGHSRGSLLKGGENIGISLPPILFQSSLRKIIIQAIELTMPKPPMDVPVLLDQFSQTLLNIRPNPLSFA